MIADLYELSPMQQGMLFRALEAPESRAFFNQFSCRLRGELEPDLLRQAWQKLADRHAALRTSFHWEKLDKPIQVVHRQATIPWSFTDWRGIAADVCRQRWQEHLEADLREGFRLDRPPLMRCRLARTGEREYLFNWSHHHLLMDGWCLSLVLDELFSVYAGMARGLPSRPAPVRPYRDYILWLQRQNAARTRDFWSRNLAGFSAPTPLPMACDRVEEAAAADMRLTAELSRDLSGRLRGLASQHQVTAGTLIQAAWAMLLSRYSGEQDVAFGLTVSGRPAELSGVETMIGVFINVIPLRVRVDGTAGLIPFLAGMRARQAERSGFEHAGLADIQRWSEVPRGQPLFQSNVILINYPFRESLSRGAYGLEISEVSMFDRDHLPLTLQATPGDQWQFELLYNSSLFEAATMERALGHLQRLLEGFVEDPSRRLAEFPILTERERLQLFDEFNNTAVDFDPNRTFIHRFEDGASAAPDRVVAEFGEQRLSWGELNRRSNQLARCMLRRSPLAPDDLVAILTRRSEKLMESILAVWKCGAAYVPIDPDYPDDRIRTLLAESQPKLAITESGMLRPSLECELELATVLYLDRIVEERQGQDGSNLGRPVKPGDLAYVIFTSGSTGKPKGAMVEHAGMLNHLLAKVHDFEIGAESSIVQSASHCFDISVWQFFAAPLAGGRTVIYSDSLVFDPDRFIQQVEADGVTILEVVPSYLSALLDRISPGCGLFSGLKYLAITGEAVKPALLDRWFQAFPRIPAINAYGPTEASDDITHCRMDRLPDTSAIPVGKPVQNLSIYVVDDYMNLCPTGIRGEICVSGIGVGRGYLRDEVKTRAAFLEDPFRAERGVRMYRTGDVGYFRADGNLMLFGRKDHQVKVRGHRIELGEIETALTRLEEIEDAVVLDCHDAGRDTYLCAYLVAKGGVSVEGERIARLLSQTLPDYMIPQAFVALDRMPLTPNGKIDRKALPAPDLSRRSAQSGYVAPRTPAEEILCSVWGEALGVDKPGVRDNFFALGGDSIISMQIVSRAARAGLRLRVSQIFQHQTVEELARVATPAAGKPAGEQPPAGSAPTSIQQRFLAQNDEDRNRYKQALPLLFSRPRSGGGSLDDIEDVYELTPTQEGMLFHNLREPSSPAYFNQLTCLIEGSLDVDAFREAWRTTIGRHPILRTSFHWEELPKPLQVVHRRARLPWRYEDFSELSASSAADRWQSESERDRALPFDHGNAPLMRLTIFRMAKQTWRFVWSQHHLLLDGWSSAIVMNDVLQFHESLRTGRTIELPRPPAFREKVRWLQRRDSGSAERFWRDKLQGFDTPTSLMLGLPEMQGARTAPHYAADEVWLSAEESSRLAALAQQYQVTLNTVAEGAWALLLSRYSGETDVVYGTIVSGRPPELEGSADMVGVFINTVPVRARLDGSSPVMPWLRSLQADLAERHEYSDCSLADIQSWSEIPGGTPLFETLLIFENYPIQESLKRGFSGIRVSEVQSFEPNNYSLSLVVTPGSQWSLKVLYDEGRFDPETVRRLLGHYQCVLQSFLADPSRTVSSVSVLTDSERTQILSDWNDTTAPIPADRTIADLFEEQAALFPERVAVRCGSAIRTYRSLSDRSQRLASHLLELAAIEADDRIAILLPRSEMMVESILAVWKAGAAYVPIDPGYPADRIRTILGDARPRILITAGPVLSADFAAAIPPDVAIMRLDRLPDHSGAAMNGSRSAPSSLAYVIYTSGSTGKPKGAMVEQRGMLNHILGMIRDLGIGPSSVVAQTASHCFDISLWQFFAALAAGGVTVICPDDVAAQPSRLIERVESDGITVMQLVPSYLVALLDELQGRARKPAFARLQTLVLIGETLKPESVRRWFELFPEIRLMNAYGPTEASDSITHYTMERAPRLAGIPVGKPVQNLRIYIVDRDMNLCPAGVKGEICVAGVGVGRGYLFDAERTRAVFAEDPFAAKRGIRLYRTGDIGCWAPDGNVLFFGRKDFQVKIRGHRIELGEIESTLAGLAEIQDAAVVAREETGGNKVLCGYVTLRAGASCGPTAIQESLRAKLPGYMIPQTIVVLAALPLTPNGKVNRKALPAPEAAAQADSSPAVFATATEQTLAGIWSDVLGHRRFGMDDRFFDIGGHSLRAIQVVSRIRRDLSAEIALADIFSLDTIRRLAEHVDRTARRLEADIPRAQRQEWYEVSHTQKRIWLASRTAEGSAAYHVGGTFQLDGVLDRRALGRALEALVERHESLRTIFSVVNGELRQKIQAPEDFGFRMEEPDLPDDPVATDAALLIREESERAFDLAHGPLFRAKLVSFSERNRLLMLTMHHIVSDAWSVTVLLNDLLRLYSAYRQEKGNPLAPLAIQYKDYAAWHNARLASGDLRSDRDYWLRQLSAGMPRLQLKYDYRRRERMTNAGGSVAFEYDESLTELMSALARKHHVSLFVLVLSAIYVMFYRSSRQEDIVIGSQSAGRDHHSLEDQVGAYLGTVVLRLRIAGNQTIETLIGSVARMLSEALEHQAYPFDLLLEEMRVRTPPGRAPLFDVQVDYVPRIGAGWAEAPDLEIADRSREPDRSKFDLSFLIRESDAGRLQFLISYNSGLFRKETIETIRDRLLDIQRQLDAGGQTIDDIRWEDGGREETGRRVHVRLKI